MVSIEQAYERVMGMYPVRGGSNAAHERSARMRWLFDAALVFDRLGRERRLRVCDLGGGTSVFAPLLAVMGMDAVLVDDFRDIAHFKEGKEDLEAVHKPLGVPIVSRDVVGQGLDFPDASFDAITCFESMEHWHASPRRVFRDVMRCLAPGGWFILSVPNAVDLKKRIETLFGVAQWSTLQQWYETEEFRGHVREPTRRDLTYIAQDMGLRNATYMGRTWILRGRNVAWRTVGTLVDCVPTLSSTLYLVGQK